MACALASYGYVISDGTIFREGPVEVLQTILRSQKPILGYEKLTFIGASHPE